MRIELSSTRSRILRGTIAVVVACATVVAAGCGGKTSAATPGGLPGGLSAAGPILSAVSGAVPGLSQAQSILGVGSLLGLAKAKMPAGQFSQIGGALPGADALIGEATKQGLPSTLGSLADVTSFLGKSGISPNQVTQMIPAIGNLLQGKVSPDLATAFLSALK